MSKKYFARVVSVQDGYTVVMDKGSSAGVKKGEKFLVIALGEMIIDPDTNEHIEQLEVVKGQVEVLHVQDKIATLKSCTYSRGPEKREVRKSTFSNQMLHSVFGPESRETEVVTPGEKHLVMIENPRVGDFLERV